MMEVREALYDSLKSLQNHYLPNLEISPLFTQYPISSLNHMDSYYPPPLKSKPRLAHVFSSITWSVPHPWPTIRGRPSPSPSPMCYNS